MKKGWYQNVQPGDEIVVYNEEETDNIEIKVIRVTEYKSIKEMLTGEKIKSLLPDVETVQEGVEVYRRFYTPEQEQEFGMVAIEVSLKK